MLQCVAVCCSVLQCVAMCCSVLQCVAARCSVGPAADSQRVLRPTERCGYYTEIAHMFARELRGSDVVDLFFLRGGGDSCQCHM